MAYLEMLTARFRRMVADYRNEPAVMFITGQPAELLFFHGLWHAAVSPHADLHISPTALAELVEHVAEPDRAVAALVNAGLWIPADGGYRIRPCGA